MAIDGPSGPFDDPRERRTDRQPDPFPRRMSGDLRPGADEDLDDPNRSDAERLAEAMDDLATRAAEQDRQRQTDRDRQRQADLQRQRQQDQQRDDDRQQAQDEQQLAQDDRQREAEREREQQAEQVEREQAREDEEDPAVDPASAVAPAVAAAAASAEAEREPNTLADRPSDIEAALDPDAVRRWQEPGVVPTREELDQALNGDPDDPSGPVAATHAGADPDGEPDRGQDGPEEDYVGKHRAEDQPGPERDETGQQVFDDQAPDPQHWAPPAAEARVDREGNERPDPEQDREPDSQTRQGGAAAAREAANQQQSETGKTVAAGGLAAGGKVVGSADNLVEAASPTGRAAQSQSWGTGRHQKPGDQALRKALSAGLSGTARASDAARAPERAPQAAPHSGAHTPGQFHQRLHQQQQRQNEQHRQQGG